MKRFIIIALLVLFGTVALNAQITFNVSPGIVSGGTFIGYKMDNIVPYIGLQYLGASVIYERTGFRYTPPDTVMVPYTNKDEMSANIYASNRCKVFY